MVRVCVIGLGLAGNLHADAYRRDKRAQLVGVCEINPQRLRAAASRLGTEAFGDAGDMLDALRPDLVSVCAGDDSAAMALQALERECHVLCEAPPAPSAGQTRELVTATMVRGRHLAVNFNLRFTPAALRAKRWLAEGRLGTPLFANLALWCAPEQGLCGERTLWQLAHHGLDLTRWLCGDITRLHCFAAKAPGRAEWSSAQVNLELAAGVVAHLTVSRDMAAHHPLARCEVAGTTARLAIENIYEEVTLFPHADEDTTTHTNSIFGGLGGYDDTYHCRISRLLEQLAGGAPAGIEGSGDDALAAQLAVEAGLKSLETGAVVEVSAPGPTTAGATGGR
jgi:predicted dehydrogenase